ncbi:F-box protein interaction domain protein [Medicago truncatula]|uniref:F-box protein interaction domain protein n=2 Tax=Medicago truncatula TaxID=3880 RepID=G7JKQ1_MEDTR|nr:F-box protein interaction domain protein [Medicago truncatula]
MEAINQPQSLAAVFPDELVAEVLSLLAVKPLMRFRCVNKFFNTLISDPHFVQMHLKNSARNPHLAVMSHNHNGFDFRVLTLPMSLLLKNPSTTIQYHPYFGLNDHYLRWRVIGSCNGLLCLIDRYYEFTRLDSRLLCLWNPATRTQSEFVLASSDEYNEFSFGYDNLNGTYKVVAYHLNDREHCTPISEIKVFSLRDNYLINIQCFPAVVPVSFLFLSRNNGGVHFSGTINWLVVRDYCFNSIITMEKYVILSINLSTETYTQLLLPRGFDDEVPDYQPRLVVLMDCLCFCYDFQNTHFVIWQMKDFGDQESWIQLYKVGYKNLFSTPVRKNHLSSSLEFKSQVMLPLYLSESGDTLIWTYDEYKAFIYKGKDNRVERIGITSTVLWLHAKDYVESLVSTR